MIHTLKHNISNENLIRWLFPEHSYCPVQNTDFILDCIHRVLKERRLCHKDVLVSTLL